MLTKTQKYLQRRYIQGKLDIVQAARRAGYKGASLTRGIERIREILKDMHIHVVR